MFKKNKNQMMEEMSDMADSIGFKFLGKEVQDAVSGVKGICTGFTLQANHNVMITITPRTENNTYQEPWLYDHNIVDITGEGVSNRVIFPEPTPFKIGSKVRDKISGYEGIITEQHFFLSGCVNHSVAATDVLEKGVPVNKPFVTERLELVGEDKSISEAPKTKTGGPNKRIERA